MASITVRQVLRKAVSRIGDSEDSIWGELESSMAGLMKLYLETLAESEVEQRVGVGLYDRSESRKDRRNGYRTRKAQLSYCVVELRIPRLRGQGYVPSYLEPNHRAIAVVEGWIEKAFLSGLSRSEVIRLMESTTGCRPSDAVIKRVHLAIDERVNAFQQRRLMDRYQYLFLDAAWAKDIVGVNATRICILTAVGITYQGRKEILGFERVTRESESSWKGFLSRLIARGLDMNTLELIISDEHKGLLNAAGEVLGDIPHQLCWAHRCRNVRKRVAASDRKAVVAGLREVYDAAHLTAAKNAFRRWASRWERKYPAVVKSVVTDSGYLLAFYRCPELHWQYLRTSNPIERVFRELRRQHYGCGAFADRDACNRAVYRTFRWLNEIWKDKDIWQPRIRKRKSVAQAA